jgi:hypothetical protein
MNTIKSGFRRKSGGFSPVDSINKEFRMNVRVKELVFLGASVSAHCFPCFDYHLGRAANSILSFFPGEILTWILEIFSGYRQ